MIGLTARPWITLSAVLGAVLCGTAVSLVEGSAPPTVLICTIAATPLLAWVTSRFPAVSLGLLVAIEPLEAFSFATPLGDISPGIVMLMLLLIMNAERVRCAYSTRPLFRATFWVLALWIGSYVFRVNYEDPGLVARQMITIASFVAIMVAAAGLAGERRVLGWTTAGAVVALSVLGFLGALAGLGIIPLSGVSQAPRELLGILSPFTRNYGLSLPNDTLDVLFPLAVAGTLVGLFSRDSLWGVRVASAAGLVAVVLAALLVFQSRSMLAQLGVALVVAAWVTGIPFRKLLAIPLLVSCAIAAQSIMSIDATATTLHAASIFGSIDAVLNDPLSYVLGRSENALFAQEAAQAGLAAAIGNDNAVHNLFLSNLIGGGYVAFLLICIAYLRPIGLAIRGAVRRPCSRELQVLAIAAAATLVAVSVEPVRANILGSWLVLGLIVGTAALQPKSFRSSLGERLEREGLTAAPIRGAEPSTDRLPGLRPGYSAKV